MANPGFATSRGRGGGPLSPKAGTPTFLKHLALNIITDRKRVLGQGNIFTSVCHSFCPAGDGGMVGFPACITGHMTKGPTCRGGLHLGGWADTPLRALQNMVNKRAVRTLLENILVW